MLLPRVLEDESCKLNATVRRAESPNDSHRTRHRSNHAEIKDCVREMKFMPSLPIQFVDREMSRCSHYEKNQKDGGDWDIDFRCWSSSRESYDRHEWPLASLLHHHRRRGDTSHRCRKSRSSSLSGGSYRCRRYGSDGF